MRRPVLRRSWPWLVALGAAVLIGPWVAAAADDDAGEPERSSDPIAAARAQAHEERPTPVQAPAGPVAAHQALAMDAQLQRLADLQEDGRPPSAYVDPEILAFMTPDDNETTPERVELGRKLYFETRLSSDNTVSCATCHDVSRGFTDHRPTSEGVQDQLGKRNAPTTMNALLMNSQFLDGRSADLEAQAKLPIINPIEMGQPDGETAVQAIANDPEYQRLFRAAYGRDPNYEDTARAIAAFERTLVFLDSPFRRFLEGDEDAISDQAKEGWVLYNGQARCVTCHPLSPSNPIGSDGRFHNVGVAARHQDFEKLAREALDELSKDGGVEQVDRLALETDLSELGRFMVSKDRSDIGAFKTLQTTNAGLTAPYMHDGSMDTLWDVMDHYNKGGEANPFLDGGIEPLDLTDAQIDAVVAFLFTLTDERFAEQNQAEFERQKALAAERRPFRDEALAQRRVLLFERRVMGEQQLPPEEPMPTRSGEEPR